MESIYYLTSLVRFKQYWVKHIYSTNLIPKGRIVETYEEVVKCYNIDEQSKQSNKNLVVIIHYLV